MIFIQICTKLYRDIDTNSLNIPDFISSNRYMDYLVMIKNKIKIHGATSKLNGFFLDTLPVIPPNSGNVSYLVFV